MKLKSILFLLVFTSLAMNAQTTEAPKFGKGLLNLVGQDSTWTMNLSARIQMLSATTWNHDGDQYGKAESNTLIRRSRLKFSGHAFSPKLKYKMELGLSNRDIGKASAFTNEAPKYILDAVVKWNFTGNLVLWAGQTKLPGNVERVISSGDLQLVDRSLLNSKFTLDRDMGLQLWHHFMLSDKFMVKEKLSVSQGEGRNITTGNLGGHQYTGRIELFPFGTFKSKGEYRGSDLKREQTPKLMLAATYNFNDDAVKDRGSQGSYNNTLASKPLETEFYQTDVTTVFVDAVFKYKGLSFMGEYASRESKEPTIKDLATAAKSKSVLDGFALNGQLGYLFKNNFEIAGRYTKLDYNAVTEENDIEQYTLGFSKYIAGHKLKVQTDVSYQKGVVDLDQELMYRLQFDIHF